MQTPQDQSLGRARRLSGQQISTALAASCVLAAGVLAWTPNSASAQQPARPAASPSSGAAPAADKGAPPSDVQQSSVSAVVNGEQITRDRLARECLLRYGNDVLESFIKTQLIYLACQERGIAITEQDVNNEVARMAAKFNLTTDRMLQAFEDEGKMTRGQYRREFWKLLALRRLAADRIEVKPDELRKAFESEYGPKVKVRMIALADRAEAERVQKLALAQPNDFARLAREHSEDESTRSLGGAIPPVRKNLSDAKLEQVVFSLKEGQVSPVTPWADQFLIVKCEQHLPATVIAGQQLQIVEQNLTEQIRDHKLREASAELFRELKDNAEVEVVFNHPEREKQLPGVAAIINGRQVPLHQLAEDCLSLYGEEVLAGEINRLVLLQELRRRKLRVEDQDIDAEVARAAESFGYVKPDKLTPDVERWLQQVTENDNTTVELYVRDAVWPTAALKKITGDNVQISEEELQKGFESNYGPRVEVLAIVMGDQRKAIEVWEHARDNNTDQFFSELASQYSIEPVTRENGGQVPPLRRYGGQPKLEEAAFKLNRGDLSGVITVGDKHVILRCRGRTTPVVPASDFDSVKDELYRDIHEKKLRVAMANTFDHLMENAQIDNFLTGSSQAGKRIRDALAPGKSQRR